MQGIPRVSGVFLVLLLRRLCNVGIPRTRGGFLTTSPSIITLSAESSRFDKANDGSDFLIKNMADTKNRQIKSIFVIRKKMGLQERRFCGTILTDSKTENFS